MTAKELLCEVVMRERNSYIPDSSYLSLRLVNVLIRLHHNVYVPVISPQLKVNFDFS